MMRLLIDADACPVVDRAIDAAARRNIPVTLVCDDAHQMSRAHAETVTVSRGADSADFALVNLTHRGDIVVTQDYGLAAMCLAKGARILHQDGREYTDQNIDGLLAFRHEAKKFRRRLQAYFKNTRIQRLTIEIVPVNDTVGGGTFPQSELAGYAVALRLPEMGSAGKLAEKLRRGSYPVITGAAEDKILFHLRTMRAGDDKRIIDALGEILSMPAERVF